MKTPIVDEEKNDKLTRKIFFGLSVFFFAVMVINGLIRVFSDGIAINYEFLTPFPSTIVLFCIFAFFLFFYLMQRLELWGRLLVTAVVVIGACFSPYVVFMAGHTHSTIQQGVHTIYIEEYRLLFDGTDYLYYKENFLWSRYLDSAKQSEECHSTYDLQGDVLTITENWEGGNVHITEIYLSNY